MADNDTPLGPGPLNPINTNKLSHTISGGGILSLTIKDKSVLYTAYMPYLRTGGLFIPTARPYKLGEELHLVLSLLSETDKLTVWGIVCWVTPKGAHGNRAPGIGVMFKEPEGKVVRDKIETALAGMLNSETPTHTM
ncbi:MAG: pilus assembly protein PilZ [Francisellaceae bacterium]|nr:pilus assembly protein PilZ [Francisellaceae bacterium]